MAGFLAAAHGRQPGCRPTPSATFAEAAARQAKRASDYEAVHDEAVRQLQAHGRVSADSLRKVEIKGDRRIVGVVLNGLVQRGLALRGHPVRTTAKTSHGRHILEYVRGPKLVVAG